MKTINKIMLLLLATIAFSCDDVLEDNIADDTVQIISPVNGAHIESNVVNFQWNSLKGADKYRVQVYGDNQVMILDSLVNNQTNLTYALAEGNYQWRIRGENFAYQSIYSIPVSFSMAFTDDLTNQLVVLSGPNNNVYLKSANLTFSWQPMPNATSYSIVVKNDATTAEVFSNPSIIGTSIVLNDPSIVDGVYQWSVKAKNSANSTETLNATIRKFFIDSVAPNQPTLTGPPNNDSTPVIGTSITFTWSMPADSGIVNSPISYVIEFSHDNFATPTPFLTLNATTNSKTQSFDTLGDYYWRVKAIDEAGNVSALSAVRKFILD